MENINESSTDLLGEEDPNPQPHLEECNKTVPSETAISSNSSGATPDKEQNITIMMNSLYGDEPINNSTLLSAFPMNRILEGSEKQTSPVKTPVLMPSVIQNKLQSPNSPAVNTPSEISSPGKKFPVLGKEQIKKRLQSFSLMKQGINATPIKKILTKPKVVMQIVGEHTYDENGEKIDEKVIVKKPPKKGERDKRFYFIYVIFIGAFFRSGSARKS